MADDIFDDLTQLTIENNSILTMNPRDQVWTLDDIDLIALVPLNLFMILVALFHCFRFSMTTLVTIRIGFSELWRWGSFLTQIASYSDTQISEICSTTSCIVCSTRKYSDT